MGDVGSLSCTTMAAYLPMEGYSNTMFHFAIKAASSPEVG
jgi:hypothetical protein